MVLSVLFIAVGPAASFNVVWPGQSPGLLSRCSSVPRRARRRRQWQRRRMELSLLRPTCIQSWFWTPSSGTAAGRHSRLLVGANPQAIQVTFPAVSHWAQDSAGQGSGVLVVRMTVGLCFLSLEASRIPHPNVPSWAQKVQRMEASEGRATPKPISNIVL